MRQSKNEDWRRFIGEHNYDHRYAKLNDVTSLPVLRRKESLTWLDSVCALQGELSPSSERPVLHGDLAQRGEFSPLG